MPKQKTTTIEDIKSLIKKLPKEEFYLDKRELKHFIDAVSKDYNSEYYNGLSKKMTELYDSDNKRHHFISTLNISGSSHDNIRGLNSELSKIIGSKVNFSYKVDESLIGGMSLQLGSLMIDTSVKNKLKKYEKVLLEV